MILTADDYGISNAVSAGIEELAAAGRLSATSCMVTFPEWSKLARRLGPLRGQIAIGLHVNLTAGHPLGPMPIFAPGGVLPTVGDAIRAAARRAVDTSEIEAEVGRQLDTFAQHAGFVPDYLDGHQHVHAMSGLRNGVLAALAKFDTARAMLVRDPSDSLVRIARRGLYARKAIGVSALAFGFAKAAGSAGFAVNSGFSGFSKFDLATPFGRELKAAFSACGPRHLAMCHPGHVDAVLATRDSVTVRREQEYATLMAAEGLAERLWRPDRGRANIWDQANA